MKKEKKDRPKYNLWQNTVHIFKLAWKEQKLVITTCLAPPVLTVMTRLNDIYIAPSILKRIEQRSTFGELIATISVFVILSIVFRALNSYNNCRVPFSRQTLRQNMKIRVNEKAETTSYPNLDDQNTSNLLFRALNAVNSYSEYWWRLSVTLTNFLGFFAYLWVLRSLHPMLVTVSILTTLLSTYVTKRLNDWEYTQNSERAEYDRTMDHILNRVQDINAAKDIRIFGMAGRHRNSFYISRLSPTLSTGSPLFCPASLTCTDAVRIYLRFVNS